MAATQTVTLEDDVEVVVRTLTAAEIYEWQVEIEAKEAGELPCNPAYDLFFDDCGLDDLARMCDLRASELAAFTHVELDPVLETARRLNPPFFRTRAAMVQARVAMTAQHILAARETLHEPH